MLNKKIDTKGLEKIDKNFANTTTSEEVEWYDASKQPCEVYGVYYSDKDKDYRRYSKEVGESVSLGYLVLSDNSTGGRVRFKTDSPFVNIKIHTRIAEGIVSGKSSLANNYGFALYSNGIYIGLATAELKDLDVENNKVDFTRQLNFANYDKATIHDCVLYMPLYGGAKRIEIGIKKGCTITAGNKYKYQKPIAFYGSSITQGGCASKAGNDYVNLLSQMLDTDVFNFSCSGSCKAEQSACDFLSSLDPSIYVLDYDYNAPTIKHLQDTHFNLYQTIRKAHSTTPIVLVSAVNSEYMYENGVASGDKRRQVIFETYQKAINNGDKNIYFVDGRDMFPKDKSLISLCTVDNCHPNDIGFYYMANGLAPLLKEILEK